MSLKTQEGSTHVALRNWIPTATPALRNAGNPKEESSTRARELPYTLTIPAEQVSSPRLLRFLGNG